LGPKAPSALPAGRRPFRIKAFFTDVRQEEKRREEKRREEKRERERERERERQTTPTYLLGQDELLSVGDASAGIDARGWRSTHKRRRQRLRQRLRAASAGVKDTM